jgi:nitrite reductase (NADH) large subunit
MKVVIVGLGVAGAHAARTIATERPGTQIEIYGAEPHLYYARPKLPAFLAGEIEQDELYLYPSAWYEERGITVHTGARVERVDPHAHRITLAEGTDVGYDRLLLATGSSAFVPPIEGVSLPGVFALRTLDDAARIRAYARAGKRAVVIGGGLLGLEAARSLRALGLEVTALESGPWLMRRQLDEEGAAIFQKLITGLGIGVQLNAVTERIEGTSGPQAVLLRDGLRLPADLVLVAAGVRSNLQLAQAASLDTNRGVVVGSHLQTSAPDIYAAGDVAEFNGTVYGIVPAAIEQARAAARNLAEIAPEEYGGTVPTNTLKIVGIDLTSAGEISGTGEGFTELRRAEPAGRYIKLVLKDGRLQGAILLGHKEKVSLISQAVARQLEVGSRTDALLDDAFDWKSLL